jgi:hypothetical protein
MSYDALENVNTIKLGFVERLRLSVCFGIFSLDMKRLVSLDCSHPKGSSYPRGGF